MEKRFIALMFFVVSLFNLNAYLTKEEQDTILKKNEITALNHSEIKGSLDVFCASEEVLDFLKTERPVNWQAMMWSVNGEIQKRMNTGDSEEVQRITNQKIFFSDKNSKIEQSFNERLKKFKNFCAENSIKLIETGSMIIVDGLIEGHLIKISKHSPLHINNFYKGIGTKEKPRTSMQFSPTLYQLVSRVFYAQDVIAFADKDGIKHIKAIKKYFYHIPGQPKDLVDENYIVVVEKVNDLPEVNQNTIAIKSIWKKAVSGDQECRKIMAELLDVMEVVGIWEFKARDILFLQNLKTFVFIDLERPGYGGSEERYFYHKNSEEVRRNFECGLKELAEFLEIKLDGSVEYKINLK